MSPPRIYAVIPMRVRELINSNTIISKLAAQTITAAANAHNSRGKKSFFGFGKDLEKQAIVDFETVAERYLDALENAGAFDIFPRNSSTYYVLVETLSGDWNHSQIASSRMFVECLKAQGLLKDPITGK